MPTMLAGVQNGEMIDFGKAGGWAEKKTDKREDKSAMNVCF